MKTKTFRRSIASIILTLALVTSMFVMPMSATADDSVRVGMPTPSVLPGSPGTYTTDPENPHPVGPTLGQSTIVGYGGHEWVVIGWDGSGVASEKDTATLLLSDDDPSLIPTTGIFFDPTEPYSNEYETSNLQAAMNTVFLGFPTREQSDTIVTPRTLNGGSGNMTFALDTTGSLGRINSEPLSTVAGNVDTSQYTMLYVVDVGATFDWYAYDAYRRDNPNIYVGDASVPYHPDNVAGSSVANQALWPLSNAEVSLLDPSIRSYSLPWWLRSPGQVDIKAAYVDYYGSKTVNPHGVSVSSVTAVVRPAFNLNLKSVVFTSAAAGSKSDTVGQVLSDTTLPLTSEKLKFTVIDEDLDLATSSANRIVKSGDTVSIPYSGASIGVDNYVSVVIEDEDNEVIFYGKLAELTSSQDASGTAQFIVPDEVDLPEGDYTLRVFDEEIVVNENSSDFASKPVDILLTVDNTPPILTAGNANRTSIPNATVKFTSNEAGTYYYKLDGAAPADAEALVSSGTNPKTLASGAQTIVLSSLTKGIHKIYIAGKDAVGNVSNLISIQIPDPDSTSETPDHRIIKHSHDKKYGGKDGLTAFGEDVVVEFKGDLEGVTEFKFNNNEKLSFTLSPYVDNDTPRTIKEATGEAIGTITHGSAIVTLPEEFANRLENGTHELQVWFNDSKVGDKSTAGVATIVVNREGTPTGGDPISPLIPPLNPLDPSGQGSGPVVLQTGDIANLNLLFVLGGVSFVILLALIAYRRRLKALTKN
ncbi:MAG: hypothetical protein LBN34_01000 [Clostridiales Family XIII bacterium]|jgi:hypothetical protein|nr:hypothetical protein [Clostridiales Family XIII bacterium]